MREVVPLRSALRLSRGWIEHCNLVGWGANCPRRWELLLEMDDPEFRGMCSLHPNRLVLLVRRKSMHEALRSGHPVVKALALDRG